MNLIWHILRGGMRSSYFWYEVAKYSWIALAVVAVKVRKLVHWRHDGYIAHSGYVHACSRCGKLPAGAYRKGPYGDQAELPAEYAKLVERKEREKLALDREKYDYHPD